MVLSYITHAHYTILFYYDSSLILCKSLLKKGVFVDRLYYFVVLDVVDLFILCFVFAATQFLLPNCSFLSNTSETPLPSSYCSVEMENKPCQPCSIRCQGVMGMVPTLQCRLCLCLYHYECVGLSSQIQITSYVCKVLFVLLVEKI